MTRTLSVLLALAMPGAAAAQAGLAEDYRPFVAPLASLVGGCLEQSWDEDSAMACHRLSVDACRAMGPSGHTNHGLVMCAMLLGDVWDAELAQSWAAMQDGMEPDPLEDLRAEQAAWEDYRQAAALFASSRYTGGSIAAHIGSEVWAEMTAERVAWFREVLDAR